MSDIHALSGAYAVDALDDAERAQFEEHLAGCAACRSEVESLRETAALLAETTIATPSAGLRDRVLADIGTVRPLPPETGSDTVAGVTALEPRRRRRVTALLAAAAAVVAIGTGGIVWQQTHDGPGNSIDRVLEADDAQSYRTDLGNGATATVVRSRKLEKAVLVTEGMPAAPSGHQYVLWLQHGDTLSPAGVMPPGADNEVLFDGDAGSATGAAVSVEDAGLEPTAPSDDVVAAFSFDA
jgi:anti-sigma-K factor RskA